MPKYGYIRVSTTDQNSDLQYQALVAAGCVRCFEDFGHSGAKTERPALNELLDTLQAGDTLVVWKLDRLGRSTIHLLQILDKLRDRDIAFQSLTEGVDTTTPAGRMVFSIIAAMAEMERENLRERTKAGLMAAKKRGQRLGRPLAMTEDQVELAQELLDSGKRKSEIARSLNVDYSTLRRALLKTVT